MNTLYLDKLKGGISGISNVYGAFLAEAAVVCLDAVGHAPGTILKVDGDFHAVFRLDWTQQIGENERSSWGDPKEATEYAAMGLAVLLLEALTEYCIFERSDQKGDGDFLVKSLKSTSQASREAVLEVSGLIVETEGNTIGMRLSKKRKKYRDMLLPIPTAFIAVVEFGEPKVKVERI